MPGPTLRLHEIVERFGGELVGDPLVVIARVATLRSAGEGDLAFLANPRYRSELAATRAAAVIVPVPERNTTAVPRIVVADPYLYFAKVSAALNPPPATVPGIHPTAVIDAGARISSSAAVGPHCHIGPEADLGEHVLLGAGCVIGQGVRIGVGSRLAARVTVYAGCVLGARAIVHSGVVIGADGFGFAREQSGWLKIPQIGRVLIGDDVEVGANTTIDRGALDDTVIEDGVKLDNQIQIGHNCRIGAHTAVAGCVGIAGSSTIGRNCMIGGAAMITGHITIADNVVVSGGTLISRSITEAGVYTGVYPFEENRAWTRNAVWIRKLDGLADRVRRLERSIPAREEEQ
ncbi:MAG: UDP-3-O-(3-hydroxymyristoyl)glucosamine N-acyltransferase [Burkholderiales bacterium]